MLGILFLFYARKEPVKFRYYLHKKNKYEFKHMVDG